LELSGSCAYTDPRHGCALARARPFDVHWADSLGRHDGGGRVWLVCGSVLRSARLREKAAKELWIVVAFDCSWFCHGDCLDLIANEIVTILQTLGAQLDISDTALGLTVLAWANSAPDTISISAVAREGNVQMAIGGVYAGRMFDTAMGLGLGLAIAAAQGDSNPLGNDDTAIVSFTTLFLSVGAAAVVVPMSGYKYSKFFGYSLIGLYLVFLPLALMISFGLF